MKNYIAVACSALLLSACASTDKKISYDSCTYPDAPTTNAPSWICDQPAEGVVMQAVGYSAKLASGPGMMKDVAEAEARNRLAASFSSDVKARLSRVTDEQLTNQQALSTDTIQRIQKSVTAMELVFSRTYRTQISPTGGLYVLVGINDAAYKENLDKLLSQTVDQENPELYRKFLLQEADTALDDVAEKIK
ncbi:LPP20 family lipoprotein [Rheinheimera sp. YQF-2]|uniref:LPP20 family lipoprotein n=1 Tax=Rheinheimera lutimaris TaxID=2740584 RepID=A0A7Y5EI59_9GAMM|nr:LPP20 family lipoprotein [Rheinheimera lutimaris]NRQ43200.1 LPP20 family lipoprotein [Rheinheimera lutimaris]